MPAMGFILWTGLKLCHPVLHIIARPMALNKTASYVRRRIFKDEVLSIAVSSVTVKSVKRLLAMDK